MEAEALGGGAMFDRQRGGQGEQAALRLLQR